MLLVSRVTGILIFFSTLVTHSQSECSVAKLGEDASPGELLNCLIRNPNYDPLSIPSSEKPLKVYVKTYVYHLKASRKQESEFTAQMLLQMRWTDKRLQFDPAFRFLTGERLVMKNLWVPHVLLPNVKENLVMGHIRKDDFITVLPDGHVILTSRFKTSIICEMDLRKFPFDRQKCCLLMDSWRYNTSDLVLEWETESTAFINKRQLILSEFSLSNIEVEESVQQYYREDTLHSSGMESNSYNYSSLALKFNLVREYGFYIMDYYIPSLMLVILSWMSFWLTADAVPPRTLLGTSTMLTFILLSWSNSSSPKDSMFKANDIWAIGCTTFIFLSLVEFAFVNTIDRRDKNNKVELKKPTGKYILKSSIASKSRMRVRRSSSCPSSPEIRRHFAKNPMKQRNRTVQEMSGRELARGVKEALKEIKQDERRMSNANIFRARSNSFVPYVSRVAHWTPQEIAAWIDHKSRIVFPVSFVLFNVFYWCYIWI